MWHCHDNVTPLPQATVLEEMPPFPERESSLLAKLYHTAPWTAKLHQGEGSPEKKEETTATSENAPPVANGPLLINPLAPAGNPGPGKHLMLLPLQCIVLLYI